MVALTFNPSTWESQTFNPNASKAETGRNTAGLREEYKARRTQELRAFSQVIVETAVCPFQPEELSRIEVAVT